MFCFWVRVVAGGVSERVHQQEGAGPTLTDQERKRKEPD